MMRGIREAGECYNQKMMYGRAAKSAQLSDLHTYPDHSSYRTRQSNRFLYRPELVLLLQGSIPEWQGPCVLLP